MFYSKSTGGFYDLDINGTGMPADVVEISTAAYQSLMAGQCSGLQIVAGADGQPTLQEVVPTTEQVRAQKVGLVQAFMDRKARDLNYDSIATAVTYADEPSVPKFQKEGQALREWRSLVWHKCYQILDEVSAGTRDVPSDAGLIAELPHLNFPAA